jgi:cell division protein FtsA
MFDQTPILVGLEVGTSKVCAVVGELHGDGQLTIIGLGQSPSRGVRKGEITDLEQARLDIQAALSEAEQMANVEIRSVFLGVSGAHIRGFNNRGVHPITSEDHEVTEQDVHDVIQNAQTINLPASHEVIHAIRQHFLVDGQDGILNPVGMLGGRLEVDVHIIHGHVHRLQNAVRAVRELHLEVEDVVFNGLASALAILDREQKELGALVVDMGGGTTDYVVYTGGILRHAGVLAVGGDHLTNDLASGLKVALSRAEQLKVDYGAALVDDRIRGQTLDLTNEFGATLRTVHLEHLRRIMHLRLEETFELVRQEIEEAGLYESLRAGVFLCGGCARIPLVTQLAEQVFGLPVFQGRTQAVNGLKTALDQPEFACAIGLLKYGAQRRRPALRSRGLMQNFTQTLRELFFRR